jgi:hypothetical protein
VAPVTGRMRCPPYLPVPRPSVGTRPSGARQVRRAGKGCGGGGGTPRIVRAAPSTRKGTRRSFLTAAQKGSSGPALARGASSDPAGLTARARPQARPGAHAANLRSACGIIGRTAMNVGWPMWRHPVCLVAGHDWSGWKVRDPQRPSEQGRTCARCLRAQRSGEHMRSKLACLVGAHDWSEWEVVDLQRPGEQVRACARCPRLKNNAAIVPLRTWTQGLG